MKIYFNLISILLVLFFAEPSAASVLLSDNFSDGNADGWTEVDNGTNNSPSNWGVTSGVYQQTSNIWSTASGRSGARDDEFYGTYSYQGSLSWSDYILRVRVRSGDNDQIGVMFRYQDDGNYYRFFIDNQRSVRRLEKRVGGTFTVLAEDYEAYEIGRWYDLRVELSGSDIRVFIDNVELFYVTDTSLAAGMVALYCWANAPSYFDDIEVSTSGSADTTPPDWDSDVGICSAVDNESGGSVKIEFGSATDDMDGSNVKYNVYYAVSSSWNDSDWSSNNVLLNVSPSSGSTCSNSYNIEGLLNAEEYTFGVRVEDQSGNEDNNLNSTTAVPSGTGFILLSDNFSDGNADGWTEVDNGTNNSPSNWGVTSGVYQQTSNIWSTASGRSGARDDEFYGTYSYQGSLSWSDYILRVRVRSGDNDQIGVMFRYQDDGNYYRFFIDNQRSVRRLEKRVGGTFTVLAEDYEAYEIGRWYDLRVELSGSDIRVFIDNVELFYVTDTSLAAGMVALYCWANAPSYFDDIEVSTSGSADTTPPDWDSDVGICSAVDNESGGSVKIEFGSATDDMDGSNVKYNVYYAVSSSWNDSDWSSNNVLLNVSPSSGSTCSNSYNIEGLLNAEEYTFGVRVEDQSGNEDNNLNSTTAVPSGTGFILLSDNFSDGNADGWTEVDNGTNNSPSNWGVTSGVYQQTSNIWSTASGRSGARDDEFYGTYSYQGSLSWSDYILRVRVRSGDNDQIGVMFRYQDDGNYYRFFIDNQRSVRRLEKRVGGTFTVLAEDYEAYEIGRWYDLRVELSGSDIRVFIDNVELFYVTDTSLATGMVALYCWANAPAYFDNIVIGGAYYVAMGDSITRGSHDDIAYDDISQDGRNTGGGYEPILNDLLTATKGYPQTVLNEGVGGDSSIDGINRIASVLSTHPFALYFLVQFGTNDAGAPVPSGLGLYSGDGGYPGSFKDNMQRIITRIKNADKVVFIAKVPKAFDDRAWMNPALQEYNLVIDELAFDNSIAVVPPDFYCFFENNPDQIDDGLHPNGTGYQSMASIWHDALIGDQYPGCPL